ncbi:MAG: hypothetical protein DRP09_21745 [Candidatus Thorarchaeota archaeon]|nr:MAG: hypothetical protein DRP09_21745 [Candidatus Thorarchaeota archaeon]
MINNWLGLEYAWVLWIVYASMWLLGYLNKDQIHKEAHMEGLSNKWVLLSAVSIVTSVCLLIIYPIACLLWFAAGIISYLAYCMIAERIWNPLGAVINKMARNIDYQG